MTKRRQAWEWVALLVACSLAACRSGTGPEGRDNAPEETLDGWRTASLSSVGMDAAPLDSLQGFLAAHPGHAIHSVLVVRHDRLVFEEYWPGNDLQPVTLEPVERDFDRETLHYVASVSKSVTATLAGIAVDEGLIAGIGESVFFWYPEYGELKDSANGEITLRHMLSFCSGFDWNEFVYGFGDPRDSHYQMFHAEDPIAWLLGRPVVSAPGSVFHYNSGDANLVGEIVRRVSSSETLLDYAEQNLFGPLGIERYAWIRFGPEGRIAFASGGISLRPRDMAKLGLLYLHRGEWDGQRVVSAAWVDEATTQAIPLRGSYRTLSGYGYNWWLGAFPFRGSTVPYYRAAGWGGQDIFVLPALDLIVVATAGGYYEDAALDTEDVIAGYILPAIRD